LQAQDAGLRIVLAAPTGKAAARMSEALRIAGASAQGEAQTLHRLLGMRADGSGFRHNRDRPLAVDVLVVDEASMIDLSLMAHLLDALPATARLILLGDRDQLAAVEAGAVFADLCASPRLADCVAALVTNFRFGGSSGIGQLADALRSGNVAGTLERLGAHGHDAADLDWQAGVEARGLAAGAREGYAAYRAAVDAGAEPGELFDQFSRFRVLCAQRSDVVAVNRALGDALKPGLPVMVIRNDPLLRLFNGDIGLALPDPADGTIKVCFPGEGADFRWIPAVRLPVWEAAWAMTVHKSQGSEFDRVLLVLPPVGSRVTTRELVYTGVTRAKRHVVLQAGEAVLRTAIASRAERMSALCERLA
jgi:exodeoxyribonuclease V alpha subunit